MSCRLLMFLTILLVLFRPSTFFFFSVGSNKINLFWAHYSPLFQWMYCILWWIVRSLIVFGALLSNLLPLRLILTLYNFMGLFKIFGKVMLRLYVYATNNIPIWWIGYYWPANLSWRFQPLCVSWPSWWVQRLGNHPRGHDRTVVIHRSS